MSKIKYITILRNFTHNNDKTKISLKHFKIINTVKSMILSYKILSFNESKFY